MFHSIGYWQSFGFLFRLIIYSASLADWLKALDFLGPLGSLE